MSFYSKIITKIQPREDYKKFVEFVIITFGETPPGRIKIRQPGVYHQGRWMAKRIYSLKIFLLRLAFKVKTEENSLNQISDTSLKFIINS